MSYWCDGTILGKDWLWTTEAVIAYTIKMSMEMDYRVHGQYTKKYWYRKTTDVTEEACDNNTWEGAVCIFETVYYPDKQGVEQSESEYVWIPEANMKERKAYYEGLGVGMRLEYEITKIDDEDACRAMNPQDTTIIPPVAQKFCWEVTIELTDAVSQTYYLWRTEAEVQAYVSGLELSGQGTASYKMAAAEDENSCNAKTTNAGE